MLNLVVDNSGSLMEGGRRFIERTVLRQIRESFLQREAPGAIRLFLLSAGGLVEAPWSKDEDVPEAVLRPHGRVSAEAVTDFAWKEDDVVVFISDFCMLPEERKSLDAWIRKMGVTRARVAVVGDVLPVGRTTQGWHSAEQVDGVLDGLSWGAK
jgi:hypothetical protein